MSGQNPEDVRPAAPEALAFGGLGKAPMSVEGLVGMWTAWNDALAKVVTDRDRWPRAPDHLDANLRAAIDRAAKDPILRAAEDSLNANPLHQVIPVDWAEITRALRTVWMRTMSRPDKAMAAALDFQSRQIRSVIETWSDAWQRLYGVAPPERKPANGVDKRFAAPEWYSNPAYATLRELYLLASDWLVQQAHEASDLSPAEQRHLDFHLRQFVDATSPTLMLLSNPAAMKRAIETGGASVAEGMRNLMHDLKAGKLSMVDVTAFAPGKNIAISPGKVVYRNKLIELIQYEPKTESVYQTPILFLPPWINKYYILDLNPKKSMVRHLVEQGFTVFVISWRNPDASMEGTSIEDYVDLGPLAASDVVRQITGSPTVNVMGYCIGGTLLAMTLAWLAAKGDHRFNAATFMVSLQDFSTVGDTAVFLGEPTSVDFIEQQMLERGYLDSRELSNMFNLLRSNDLIWSNVVNNYLMGLKPPAFDLLYWNSDGTRMARAAHGWYLRNTYVENNLVVPGKIHLKGEALDLGRIQQDIYAVGAEKDHIVPWAAASRITSLMGGAVRFVLASSGHIAGIINPPGGKGAYWTNEHNEGDTPELWRAASTRHDGSWWTDWFAWLATRSGARVAPPPLGSEAYPPLQDAPGQYVMDK